MLKAACKSINHTDQAQLTLSPHSLSFIHNLVPSLLDLFGHVNELLSGPWAAPEKSNDSICFFLNTFSMSIMFSRGVAPVGIAHTSSPAIKLEPSFSSVN